MNPKYIKIFSNSNLFDINILKFSHTGLICYPLTLGLTPLLFMKSVVQPKPIKPICRRLGDQKSIGDSIGKIMILLSSAFTSGDPHCCTERYAIKTASLLRIEKQSDN